MLIGICDDDKDSIRLMKASLERNYPDYTVRTYTNPEDMLDDAHSGIQFDALLLDIIMPKLSGMDLGREIKELSPETAIAFITSSEEYAIEAFSLNALHYIVKPITDEKLKDLMERIQREKSVPRQSVLIRSGRDDVLMRLDEIQYLECHDHYVFLNLRDGSTVRAYYSVAEIREILGDSFLLLSRGFIVNMDYIRQMKSKSCILKDGREILLSRKYLKEIHAAFDAYIFRMLGKFR
ncbi:MAG: response regulator transcription factor [Lachnospiraceae bacterium]|nr:response regulator transcription factor [Lachnospiraceae bacterium]MBR1522884.1 response regulator transcription factor [Lachnospiraceae bacterium]